MSRITTVTMTTGEVVTLPDPDGSLIVDVEAMRDGVLVIESPLDHVVFAAPRGAWTAIRETEDGPVVPKPGDRVVIVCDFEHYRGTFAEVLPGTPSDGVLRLRAYDRAVLIVESLDEIAVVR